MRVRESLSLFLVLLLALSGSLAAQERLPVKQLAGPIDEMRTGVMAPVDPVDAGTRSLSAMIPVDLVQGDDGDWTWSGKIAVDSDRFAMVLFAGDDSWSVAVGPSGSKSLSRAEELAASVERTSLEFGDSYEGDYYRFEDIQPGEWKVSVKAEAPVHQQGYLLYSSGSPYRLLSYQTGTQLVGDEISFVGYGIKKTLPGLEEKIDAVMVEQASMRVTLPTGKILDLPMFDDGLHGDELAGDGVFGGSLRTKVAGEYHVQVIAQGVTPEGMPFVRTAEHLVPVLAPQVELTLDVAAARIAGDQRLSLTLPVFNAEGAPEKYRVFAEVWGLDALGAMQPVSWIGGMSYVEDGQIELGLDMRWIGLSKARSGFELRNVRVEDPDTFIPVALKARMAVDTPDLPALAFDAPKRIDEEMLMGPRPERAVNKAPGGKLMLVHGYCSGNAWGGQTGQFTDDILFQDFNQNRSHDQFAVLIGTFGASYPSFGVVAHSQGGAASLHLYTYYWSGLDFADPGRLIQSVGTPYQGTALAGNAAVLGQIFGVGCGTNYDLTYSGAANWLAGVPSWARGAVNYYTTSFEDKWWRYDYCQIVTDLLLSDPDDGTTERSKGQLSSAVNRGHKTKWCHTTGMRDPAQVTDGNRNSTMNSNAAR